MLQEEIIFEMTRKIELHNATRRNSMLPLLNTFIASDEEKGEKVKEKLLQTAGGVVFGRRKARL